jgi:hypothetical protein
MHGVLRRKPFVDLTLTEEASLLDVTLQSGGVVLVLGPDYHGHEHGHGHGHGDSVKHGHGGGF